MLVNKWIFVCEICQMRGIIAKFALCIVLSEALEWMQSIYL